MKSFKPERCLVQCGFAVIICCLSCSQGASVFKFGLLEVTVARAVDSSSTIPPSGSTTQSGNSTAAPANGTRHHRYQVAKLDWDSVQAPFLLVCWVLLAIGAKTAFHYSHRLTSYFPDSALMLILGLILGFIIYFIEGGNNDNIIKIFADNFFLYILPPIVFDAGYFMPNRSFFDNFGTILVYAVIATLFNMVAIGFSLWGCGLKGLFALPTPLDQVLTFAAIISAVDPVAVLVVFEEIHVNAVLYITVFGESLLNDAVAVVLYEMFDSFSNMDHVEGLDILLGIVSFFVVSLGGVGIGLIYSLVCSICTRFTHNVRIIEPLLILLMGYLSYLTAEMFHLSGILAIVFCGITMRQYVEENISEKSRISVQYLLKMLCTSAEAIIFMFLGLTTISRDRVWDTAFILLTLLFCLVYRFIGTFALSYLVNKHRLNKLKFVDQFIMSYGGLRGAIAYGLVSSLDAELFEGKRMYVTSIIVVIYFTVFLQGITIKPLVKLMEVKLEEHKEEAMGTLIFEKSVDDLTSGVEAICGLRGHHWMRNQFDYINSQYIKPLLISDYYLPDKAYKGDKIKEVFMNINLKSAIDHLDKHGGLNFMNMNDVGGFNAETISKNSDNDEDEDEDITTETKTRLMDYLAHGKRFSHDIANEPEPEPAIINIEQEFPYRNSVFSHASSIKSSKSLRSPVRAKINNRQRRRDSGYPGMHTTALQNIRNPRLRRMVENDPGVFVNELRRLSMSPNSDVSTLAQTRPTVSFRRASHFPVGEFAENHQQFSNQRKSSLPRLNQKSTIGRKSIGNGYIGFHESVGNMDSTLHHSDVSEAYSAIQARKRSMGAASSFKTDLESVAEMDNFDGETDEMDEVFAEDNATKAAVIGTEGRFVVPNGVNMSQPESPVTPTVLVTAPQPDAMDFFYEEQDCGIISSNNLTSYKKDPISDQDVSKRRHVNIVTRRPSPEKRHPKAQHQQINLNEYDIPQYGTPPPKQFPSRFDFNLPRDSIYDTQLLSIGHDPSEYENVVFNNPDNLEAPIEAFSAVKAKRRSISALDNKTKRPGNAPLYKHTQESAVPLQQVLHAKPRASAVGSDLLYLPPDIEDEEVQYIVPKRRLIKGQSKHAENTEQVSPTTSCSAKSRPYTPRESFQLAELNADVLGVYNGNYSQLRPIKKDQRPHSAAQSDQGRQSIDSYIMKF